MSLDPLVGGTGARRDQQRANHGIQKNFWPRLPPGSDDASREYYHEFQDGNARLGELDVIERAGQARRSRLGDVDCRSGNGGGAHAAALASKDGGPASASRRTCATLQLAKKSREARRAR